MNTVLHVTVNDEKFISEELLTTALAGLYARKDEWKLVVAILCDDYLDPSGALLGRVRGKALKQLEHRDVKESYS